MEESKFTVDSTVSFSQPALLKVGPFPVYPHETFIFPNTSPIQSFAQSQMIGMLPCLLMAFVCGLVVANPCDSFQAPSYTNPGQLDYYSLSPLIGYDISIPSRLTPRYEFQATDPADGNGKNYTFDLTICGGIKAPCPDTFDGSGGVCASGGCCSNCQRSSYGGSACAGVFPQKNPNLSQIITTSFVNGTGVMDIFLQNGDPCGVCPAGGRQTIVKIICDPNQRSLPYNLTMQPSYDVCIDFNRICLTFCRLLLDLKSLLHISQLVLYLLHLHHPLHPLVTVPIHGCTPPSFTVLVKALT